MTRTERLAVIGIAFFALLCRATEAPHVFAGLRLPYATDGPQATRALGAYAVAIGETRATVPVSEQAVIDGPPLPIAADDAGRGRETAS